MVFIFWCLLTERQPIRELSCSGSRGCQTGLAHVANGGNTRKWLLKGCLLIFWEHLNRKWICVKMGKNSKSSECQWNYFKCQHSGGEWKMWNMVCKVLHISLIWIRLEFVFVWKTHKVWEQSKRMWGMQSLQIQTLCKLLKHRVLTCGHFSSAHAWTYCTDILGMCCVNFAFHWVSSLLSGIMWDLPKKKWQCIWILVI